MEIDITNSLGRELGSTGIGVEPAEKMGKGREMREASKKTQSLMRQILSEDEVRIMTRRIRKVIGPILGELSSQYGLDIEDSVRFGAVATRLREAREAHGMDLKTAAKVARVPQYRLRYIEECNLRLLRSSDLEAYVDFLALNEWFSRWRKANSKLAARLAPKAKSKVAGPAS